MSEFLYHAPCPNCFSKDNLAVYDDHSWCFGCGYREGRSKNLRVSTMIEYLNNNNNKKDSDNYGAVLPLDCSSNLPDVAESWLNKFDISEKEVYDYKLCWSEERERLYFPIFAGDGSLLLYQGRYFGNDSSKPKYITSGKSRDLINVLGKHDSGTVIACEDMISAIKIARHENCWCLFGSNIATEALERCSRLYSRLGVWLDRDKLKYALQAQLRASVFFEDTFVISSEKDPKYYNDKEIYDFLYK